MIIWLNAGRPTAASHLLLWRSPFPRKVFILTTNPSPLITTFSWKTANTISWRSFSRIKIICTLFLPNSGERTKLPCLREMTLEGNLSSTPILPWRRGFRESAFLGISLWWEFSKICRLRRKLVMELWRLSPTMARNLRHLGRINPGNHPLQQEGYEESWHIKWHIKKR